MEQHPVLKKYLDREMQIKESVFQQLFKHQNSASAAERMEELKQEIILTQEALKVLRVEEREYVRCCVKM